MEKVEKEEADKFVIEFVKENEELLALLGLAGVVTGDFEDKDGLFAEFARYCKENGISREEAFKALAELIDEAE